MIDQQALTILESIRFDSCARQDSVWRNDMPNIMHLHDSIVEKVTASIDRLSTTPESNKVIQNPMGHVVLGAAGSGKTHLLKNIRIHAVKKQAFFVLCDLTDASDFWNLLLQSYLDSLDQKINDNERQVEVLVNRLLGAFFPKGKNDLQRFKKSSKSRAKTFITQFIGNIVKKHRPKNTKYIDTLSALLLLIHDNYEISSIGQMWLQGDEQELSELRAIGIKSHPSSAIETVQRIAWVMGLVSPTLLAFDQIDAITSQYKTIRKKTDTSYSSEQQKALRIVEGVASGLMDSWNKLDRIVSVVVALEDSWHVLADEVTASVTDRFQSPSQLRAVGNLTHIQAFVESYLAPIYQQLHYTPPAPIYPFNDQLLQKWVGLFPRKILKNCEEQRRIWVSTAQPSPKQEAEIETTETARVDEDTQLVTVRELFQQFYRAANLADLTDHRPKSENLAPIVSQIGEAICMQDRHALNEEFSLACHSEFSGSSKSLHLRLRIIDHSQGDLEQHFSFRALQVSSAHSFITKLSSAITAAGIDRELSFRRLVVLRFSATPNGPRTAEEIQKFESLGGEIIYLSAEDIRTMYATAELFKKQFDHVNQWLETDRPLANLGFLAAYYDRLQPCLKGNNQPPDPEDKKPTPPSDDPLSDAQPNDFPIPSAENTKVRLENGSQGHRGEVNEVVSLPPSDLTLAPAPKAESKVDNEPAVHITLGRKVVYSGYSDHVDIPLNQLQKHSVILAGAGSGKTVLVKHIIEQAALHGVPSIIIDGANDMVNLGTPWRTPPSHWTTDDKEQANTYFSTTETHLWTPGRSKGNPCYFEAIPDLFSLKDDTDELEQAISMTQSLLSSWLITGKGQKDRMKQGVLRAALRYFAQFPNHSIDQFIHLLQDLPESASGNISKAPALAQEMADLLAAKIQEDPLLRENGAPLDLNKVFAKSSNGKTPISVFNLIGLPDKAQQEQFVSQLCMSLFIWMKKNCSSTGLSGLIVIDEAKDFVPSSGKAASKEPLIRLAAQARKYGYGLIFATQAPKSIDHNVIANCSTQVFGKVSSPAAQDVVRDQIKHLGGNAKDIAKLTVGQFYAFSDGFSQPYKIQSPLCLSNHPSSPPDEPSILKLAIKSRAVS